MQRIKPYSALAGVFFFLSSWAQTSYQLKWGHTMPSHRVGVGLAESLRPRVQLMQGAVSLQPVRSIHFFIDYQRPVKGWPLHLSWGSRVMLSFYKGWWDLSREVSYYQPFPSSFALDKFDQAELFVYLQQQKVFLRRKEVSWAIFWKAGPAFSLNNHLNRQEGLVGTRSDNGALFQVCTVVQEERQPVWLPFLRAGAGMDFIANQYRRRAFVLSAFFEIATLQKDRLRFTILPDDPLLRSTGNFRWNRNQAGFKVSFLRSKNRK